MQTIEDGTTVVELPISQVQPFPENARSLNQKDPGLIDLSHSIRMIGVLQPITVHHREGDDQNTIIYGERRWRAAKLAKCSTILAFVLKITDAEAQLMRAGENEGREGIDPFAQSSLVTNLLKTNSEKNVARILCMTVPAVRLRANLSKLIPEFHKEITERKQICADNPNGNSPGQGLHHWPIEYFELIARYPKETQTRALSWAKKTWNIPSLYSVERQLGEWETPLKDATWNLTDPNMGKTPACNECPKRKSQASDLFNINDEVSCKKDICLDRSCFKRKSDIAHRNDLRTTREKYPDAPTVKRIDKYNLPDEIKGTTKAVNFYAEDRGSGLYAFYESRDQKKLPKSAVIALTKAGEIVDAVPIGQCKIEKKIQEDKVAYNSVQAWLDTYESRLQQHAEQKAVKTIIAAADDLPESVMLGWMLALCVPKHIRPDGVGNYAASLDKLDQKQIVQLLWKTTIGDLCHLGGYQSPFTDNEDANIFYNRCGADVDMLAKEIREICPVPENIAGMNPKEKKPNDAPDVWSVFGNLEEADEE